MTFLGDEDNGVEVIRAGSTLSCSWGVIGEPDHYADIECDDGSKAGYFFGASEPHGDDHALLIYGEDIYYRQCSPDVGM